MISRVRAGLVAAFLDTVRDGVERLEREGSGLDTRGLEGPGVAGVCFASAAVYSLPALDGREVACNIVSSCVLSSGGSEDGGSEPMPGFNGVRNGDLNGLWSVFAASFSRRRFACGVDIFAGTGALA